MHYSYDANVLPVHTSSNPLEVPIKISTGIIKHVSLIFPPGAVRQVYCTFWDTAEQLLPTNLDGTYHEDNYSVEIECYMPTWIYGNDFCLLAWNRGCAYPHNVRVMLDVQGVDEPDLGSTVQTLNNVIDTLVSLIKGWF
jgi:hypothetical protein